jgi:hypothetical protein
MMRARTAALVALAALAGVSSARAEPAGDPEALFREGRALMDAGKFAEACPKFEASQQLDPTVSTMLNLADCREKNGQLATAWGLFVEAAKKADAASDAPTHKLHAVAVGHAAKLEPRLSKLTITVAHELTGLEIRRGEIVVAAGDYNREVPVDGGRFTITATAPDHESWTTRIVIAPEHDAKTIEVPVLREQAHAAVPPAHARAGHSRVLPIVVGAGALVLAGGAVGFELWGRSIYSDAQAERDDATQQSLWDSANQKRYVAEGLAAVGLVAAGTAVFLYVRGRHDEEPTAVARRTIVTPAIVGDRAGIVVMGGF